MKTKMQSFSKFVWIFAACCVVGFTVETIWCFIRHGYIESRKSLVYGPLSVAYGIGGILLTAVLNRFRTSSLPKIFIISFVVGTVAEYICSLGQEIVFGSVAWDYSELPLNINGRVCLLYSIFWGVLGIGWVKLILPFFEKIIGKIPVRLNNVLVIAFVIFFVYDACLSALAGLRMDERKIDPVPSNRVEKYLDENFGDERMREIYANSEDVSAA